MATGWMQAKMHKLKRDGMRDSRGTFERFKDEPSKHVARIHPGDGWYVTPRGNFKRGLPSTLGPFKTETEAREFCKRGHISDYRLAERATVQRLDAPRVSKVETSAMMEAVRLEHEAHLAAQRELSRATREALGHRTAWSR